MKLSSTSATFHMNPLARRTSSPPPQQTKPSRGPSRRPRLRRDGATAEAREWELLASNVALVRHAQACETALAASGEAPTAREARLRALEEALALVVSEQSLEHGQVDVIERQAIAAEASLAQHEEEASAS